MSSIWCISGPCGCGKTTLSAELAAQLSRQQGGRQVCLLHGDDFHAALTGDERSPAALSPQELLRRLEPRQFRLPAPLVTNPD